MKLLLFICLLAGCGGMGNAPFMAPAETCSVDGLRVEIETGAGATTTCETQLKILAAYRDAYAQQWGVAPNITVRMRATTDLRTTGVSEGFSVAGHTYDGGIIDLIQVGWNNLPHELNHVVHGPGHAGWCSPFEPWQRATFGIDQHAYLCGGAS